MTPEKKIFFASDLHLGVPTPEVSREREIHFVHWLDKIKEEVAELYIVGDLFDFWFEYKRVVPKGYTRLFGKLAEYADAGIPIHYFAGNHDLWIGKYFTEEFNAKLYFEPIIREIHGKTYMIGHGDGLGPGDHGYKFIKKIFTNPVCKWLFHRLHPNFGIGLANYFSKTSRKKTGHKDAQDYGDNEFLYVYSKDTLKEKPEIDYFVFGHRHLPLTRELAPGKYYLNIGDWMSHYTFLTAGKAGAEMLRFAPGMDDFESVFRPDATHSA